MNTTPPIYLNQYRYDSGFSLVSMVVVLVIIGLLLSATFRGDGLIAMARDFQVRKVARELSVAVISYEDKHGALPGYRARAVVEETDRDGKWNVHRRTVTVWGQAWAWDDLSGDGLVRNAFPRVAGYGEVRPVMDEGRMFFVLAQFEGDTPVPSMPKSEAERLSRSTGGSLRCEPKGCFLVLPSL
jgi:hypothetical protein